MSCNTVMSTILSISLSSAVRRAHHAKRDWNAFAQTHASGNSVATGVIDGIGPVRAARSTIPQGFYK